MATNRRRSYLGDRVFKATRLAPEFAARVDERADELGFTVNDYLAWLCAQDLGVPDLAQSPSVIPNREEMLPMTA